MPKKTESKSSLKKILVLVFGVAFVSSSVLFIVRLLTNPVENSPVPEQTQTLSEHLKSQEEGYLIVLEREPDNTSALQGLVDIRIQLNDLEGTIAPLEKLISIYPDDENLKLLLATVQQELANQQQNQTNPD
ncbi:MAG: tetratricopeptide repeat protein [Gloeocapsa sp. DLM2.Bin57]|nr:MAG: tetratricopeptide repeat protein [Gloeocapsa sp. DLM2.Bin57]